VDKSLDAIRFGVMVPKRHARRAVTRNLVKRLAREAVARYASALPPGLWLVRLRAGFAPGAFVSARSAALVQAVRAELDGLLQATLKRAGTVPGARGAACAGAGA